MQLDNVSNFIGYSVEPLAFIGDGPAHNSSQHWIDMIWNIIINTEIKL